MHKLIPSMLEIQHDKKNKKYTLNINGEEALVEYVIKKKDNDVSSTF